MFETVEQSVGQCCALVNREGEGPFQQIRDFWTHGIILSHAFRYPNMHCHPEARVLCGLKDRYTPGL
jgi:hypothetical protein